MKNKLFDFVIGNPPYQEMVSEGNNQSKPVYNDFMDAAYSVADKTELITPARFLSKAGATPKQWNEKMLSSHQFKIFKFYEQSTDVFQGVDIKGGVVISYFNHDADYSPIDVFIKDETMRTIFEKVKTYLSKNLGELVHSPDSYRFTDTLFKENPELINRTDNSHAKAVASSVFNRYPEVFHKNYTTGDVKVIGRQNNVRTQYCLKGSYIKDQGNLHKWKVLFAGAIGTGKFGEALSEPIIAEPEMAHTQSFVSLGEFDSEFEAKALAAYMKTKFARAFLSIMKTTQNNQSKTTWSKIPIQDFTNTSDIDWSKSISEIDQQLYRKYGLSEEEIAFIETNVKEMV